MKVIDLTKESFTERVSDFRQYPDGWECSLVYLLQEVIAGS